MSQAKPKDDKDSPGPPADSMAEESCGCSRADEQTPKEDAPLEKEGSEPGSDAITAEEVSPEKEEAVKLAARAADYSDERVRTICESLLLVSERPITSKDVRDASGVEPRRVARAMDAIAGELREGVSGIVLHEVAGGWQLRTCPTSSEEVRRFLRVKPRRLTRAALETLAIVAYRQPVTRPEIEEVRGVDSGAVLKALLDREVIQIIGKKEEPGRPLLYATTKAFLEMFNLKDLSSLPTLRELHELSEESTRIVEDSFPDSPSSGGEIAKLVERALTSESKDSRTDDETVLDNLEEALTRAVAASKGAGEILDEGAGDDETEKPDPDTAKSADSGTASGDSSE